MFHHVFVYALRGKAAPEMTYTVSGETLYPTNSLTHSLTHNNTIEIQRQQMGNGPL